MGIGDSSNGSSKCVYHQYRKSINEIDEFDEISRISTLEKSVHDMLTEQASSHYGSYAAQQHPKDEKAQQLLKIQLLEQLANSYKTDTVKSIVSNKRTQLIQQSGLTEQPKMSKISCHFEQLNSMTNNYLPNNETDQCPLKIEIPLLWRSKKIAEFKSSTKQNEILTINSGVSLTINVPTHEDGLALHWEFATDYHDLGFGLVFEWTFDQSSEIKIDFSEYSDDESFADEDSSTPDVEKGPQLQSDEEQLLPTSTLPHDNLIPLFRRDCHLYTVCGYHRYQGTGNYLFKFDNTYSLWRSKSLYFKVYYCE